MLTENKWKRPAISLHCPETDRTCVSVHTRGIDSADDDYDRVAVALAPAGPDRLLQQTMQDSQALAVPCVQLHPVNHQAIRD